MSATPLVVVVVVLCSASLWTQGQGAARFVFKGVEVLEHSLVVRDEVGSANGDTLMCVTDHSPCCTLTENGWFFDFDFEGSPRPVNTGAGGWYQTRDTGVVRLHYSGMGTAEGIFFCEIRVSATELQTLYIGIYPSVDDGGADVGGDGTVTVDCTDGASFPAPEAEVPEFTLSCTSSGGPVREFSCTGPDGGNIVGVASLRIPTDATVRSEGLYDHSVNVTGNYPGVYTCQVTVYRYNGIQTPAAPEPEMVYPAAQTITVTAAAPPTDGLSATQVGTAMRVRWTPPSPTPYGYRIYYQAEGDQGPPQSVVALSDNTNMRDLIVQNGVTYTVTIQTLSSTELPSAVVEVPYQDRTTPLLMIGDQVIPNHGIVDRDVIGEGPDNTLQCLTNNLDCCVVSGSWYYPDSTEVPDSGTDYYLSRGGPGFGVNLHRGTGTLEGVFRCETPDENGVLYSRYVGVYGSGQGAVSIQSLQLTVLTEEPLFRLSCISEGGPATTVTWTRDDVTVTEDGSHAFLQIVVNTETARYTNSLTVSGTEYGTYRCTVDNDRTEPEDSQDIEVEAPGQPTSPTLTQLTTSTFRVLWVAPTTGGTVTGYRVFYTIDGDMDDVTLGPNELELTLNENRSYAISIDVQSQSEFFSSPKVAVVIPQVPSGSVSGLEGFPSLSQISVTWIPVDSSTGVITRYEVQYYPSTDGSMTMTEYTDSPMYMIKERNHGTSYTFSVTPFSLFARGDTQSETVTTLSVPPQVEGVSVEVLNGTAVMVTWESVALPLEELTGYRVDYSQVGQSMKRQTGGTNTTGGTETFPSDVNSGVIGGLTTGETYQFQVTALAITFGGTAVEGEASVVDDSTMATVVEPPGGGGGGGGGGAGGAIAGGIIAALVVVVAIVLIVVLVWWLWRRGTFAGSKYSPPPGTRGTTREQPIRYTRGTEKVTNGRDNEEDKAVEPAIQEFPKDAHVTEGESVFLAVQATGVPPPTITWYRDTKEVVADYSTELNPDGSLHILSAESRHTGTYQMVALNSAGSVERAVNVSVRVEGESTPAIQKRVVEMKPVPVAEFGHYVADHHTSNNRGFRDQYLAIDSGADRPITIGTSPKNKPLNRFANIVAYDDNRVILESIPGHSTNYVNASYVDGFTVPGKFLATQGPLPKTLVDFWRLVWQEKPPTIVMITNLKEGSKIKCQQYWPDSGHRSFGPFKITITDQQTFTDYTIRTLQVSLSGSSERTMKITQFHFTAWPDHGVPDYATPILAFHKRVKAHHHPSRGPLMVHCSAGVGRTGTFIVIDSVLEQIARDGVVDIGGNITHIRTQRMKLVQTVEQYVFIHDAILEFITCGDTQIVAADLRRSIGKMGVRNPQIRMTPFESQFKVLHQVSPMPEEVRMDSALQAPEKNRSMQYLPPDKHRVVLKGSYPDYINAAFVNGYKQPKAFIVAQGPMATTCTDFWKMVYSRQCGAIVMLSHLKEEGEEVSYQYWPTKGVQRFGEYTVDHLGEEKLEGFVLRSLSVLESTSGKAHQVSQFHITNWTPDGKCSNLKTLTDVIEEVTKVQIRTGNNPIVVHCSDTVSRSGMFCAIATTIERCKTEGVVDVFQVVKALRVQKPGAVLTVEQYRMVFDAVLMFLDSFDTYANFQAV